MNCFSASCSKQWRLVLNFIAAAVMKCESDKEMTAILTGLSSPI
jgi:hypothetical protein